MTYVLTAAAFAAGIAAGRVPWLAVFDWAVDHDRPSAGWGPKRWASIAILLPCVLALFAVHPVRTYRQMKEG